MKGDHPTYKGVRPGSLPRPKTDDYRGIRCIVARAAHFAPRVEELARRYEERQANRASLFDDGEREEGEAI